MKNKKTKTVSVATKAKQLFHDATGQRGSVNKSMKVCVAMSGGVDSSVAALLLKQKGYDVHGVFMDNWNGCDSVKERRSAERAAVSLGIPFRVWDFKKAYAAMVLSNFYREYMSGHTPNPDVLCNKEIKFGLFLAKAISEGMDYIATGHHVKKSEIRNPKSETGFSYTVLRGKDTNKDQSYFLWTLTQKQLSRSLFPIGDYTKQEVRAIAKRAGLPNHDKKDSQGICFIGKVTLSDFLSDSIPEQPGIILTEEGNIVGIHKGIAYYTEGQREGLAIGGCKEPYYVAHRDSHSNVIVVAKKASKLMYTNKVIAAHTNWIGIVPNNKKYISVKVRYRQPDQRAFIEQGDSAVVLTFSHPQWAVSVGQSAVFYDNDVVIGGGIIAAVEKPFPKIKTLIREAVRQQ